MRLKEMRTQISRSQSQIDKEDLKKLFPFTQQGHNRYVLQNRLDDLEISNSHQRSISTHIKELLQKDKTRPRVLDPLDYGTQPSRETKKRSLLSYHDSQNSNLYDQNQRREMVQLAQWLDLMVQQLSQLNLTDYQDYYNRLEVIYTGSILELQRQLSVTGFEFGQFLKKLWDSFIAQIQRMIDGLTKRNIQIEQEGLTEINRLHTWYQSAIEKQTMEVKSMKLEVELVQSQITKLQRENVYLRRKEKRREKQMEDDFQLIEDLSLRLMQHEAIIKFPADEDIPQKEVFEFFKAKFEEQKKGTEIHYKQLIVQDEFFDYSRDIIIQERGVDTSDLIKVRDYTQDTSEYFQVSNQYTQTPKKARTLDMEIQAQPTVFDQEIQVSFFLLKKDRIARNPIEQRLFAKAKRPLRSMIEDYEKFYLPEKELTNNDPQFLDVVAYQLNSYLDRNEELLAVLNLRSEINSEDLGSLKQYYDSNYQSYKEYMDTIWELNQQQISTLIDAKIDKEELEVELRDLEKRFEENIVLYKRFHQKFKEKEQISKFYEQSLIKVIRHAPQFMITQIQLQANQFGVLQNVEFKEIKRKVAGSMTYIEPQTQSPVKRASIAPQEVKPFGHKNSLEDMGASDKSQSPTPAIKKATVLAMKFAGALKNKSLKDIDDEEQDYQSGSSDAESVESDFSVTHLRLELNQKKPTLTLEKKLRIQTCTIKSAMYCTNVLKIIVQKFHAKNKDGLYKMSTVIQLYQDFIIKVTSLGNIPFHVHFYENIISHYGQSQFSDLNKYKRALKSFLYYESKDPSCGIAAKFLRAEYDVQDFNNYIQLLQLSDYPTMLTQKFIQIATKWLQNNNYDDRSIETLINEFSILDDMPHVLRHSAPFDQIMLSFLNAFEKYKNRTSAKYKNLFAALDTKGKGSITFQDWNFIYEAFYPNNYAFSTRCFYQEADYQDDQEKMMSSQRFNLVCDELNLFQEQDQIKMLDGETVEQIQAKLINWQREKVNLKMVFIKANRYDKFIKGLFQQVDENKLKETTVLIYKLLQKQSKPFFLDSLVKIGMPVEFALITQKVRAMELQALVKE